MNIWKSTGIIKYDPHVERGTFKPHWVILKCDKELVRYYQHIFYTLYFKKLQTAMWANHISLVRGEKPTIPDNWKLYNGKVIEFTYEYPGFFYSNGKHFWLKVWSEQFGDIRESLGLPREPKIQYHMSIGSLNS
jgi:hypothetical protein